MFAREAFSFHPAHPHTPSRFPFKSFLSPIYEHFTSNSFVSPTYAKTGGIPLQKCRRADIFSLFLPISVLGSLSFQSFAHSFIFRVQPISRLPSAFRTLSPKNPGYTALGNSHCSRADQACKTRPPRKAAATEEFFHELPVTYHLSPTTLHRSPVAGHSPHSPPIHNPVTPPSPIVLPVLSQWSPVRGPTHTPCLPSTRGLRYTSTDAIRPARSAHEARFNY